MSTILIMDIPPSLITCLKSSLNENPKSRTSFMEMYVALEKDKSSFDGVDEQLKTKSKDFDSSLVFLDLDDSELTSAFIQKN
jgi:hypothetical protein